MTSVAIVLPAQESDPHTVDGTQYITGNGVFDFHKIIGPDNLDLCSQEFSATQFLIIYNSHSDANTELASKILSSTFSANKTEKFDVSEALSTKLSLNDNGSYFISQDTHVSFEEAMELTKQPPHSALRVTQCNDLPVIIELNIGNDDDGDLVRSLNASLHALVQGSAYVPYRDSPLSKLLWPALAGRRSPFTSICVLDTSKSVHTLPALTLSANLFKWAKMDRAQLQKIYAEHRSGAARGSKQLSLPGESIEEAVQKALHELASFYRQEMILRKSEQVRKKHEQEAQLACELHALSRMKHESLNSLKSEISGLETQLSIAQHKVASRRLSETRKEPETWFSQELKRKQKLKEELNYQRSKLLEALAEADKFEVSEPIRGIIRQSEFNLRSLKKRIESAE